jgi:hypothetical protein
MIVDDTARQRQQQQQRAQAAFTCARIYERGASVGSATESAYEYNNTIIQLYNYTNTNTHRARVRERETYQRA